MAAFFFFSCNLEQELFCVGVHVPRPPFSNSFGLTRMGPLYAFSNSWTTNILVQLDSTSNYTEEWFNSFWIIWIMTKLWNWELWYLKFLPSWTEFTKIGLCQKQLIATKNAFAFIKFAALRKSCFLGVLVKGKIQHVFSKMTNCCKCNHGFLILWPSSVKPE